MSIIRHEFLDSLASNQTNELLDSHASISFIPLILQPTRITSHSNTLIDNICSNVLDPDIISSNLTASICNNSKCVWQYLGNKSNVYERDWSKFDPENFIVDYFSVDWEDLLKIDDLSVDNLIKI